MVDKYYLKLFLERQGKGHYHMFTFDIVESKELKEREKAQYQIIELIERIYFDLLELEALLNKQILLHDESYGNLLDKVQNDFAHRYDPFIFGDVVGITILSNSIPYEVVLDVFEKNKQEIGITFDFHVAHGDYETDDYGLGVQKSFRGYAIHILSNAHKGKNNLNLKHESSISEEELDYYRNLININHNTAVENALDYTYGITRKTLNKSKE